MPNLDTSRDLPKGNPSVRIKGIKDKEAMVTGDKKPGKERGPSSWHLVLSFC